MDPGPHAAPIAAHEPRVATDVVVHRPLLWLDRVDADPARCEVGVGEGEAPTKICPRCRTIVAIMTKECPTCGHTFVFESKLESKTSTEDIVARGKAESKKKWLNVQRAQYNIHTKIGSPDSLLITYHCGLTKVKEWICANHGGRAGAKARHVLKYRGYTGPMDTYAAFRAKDTIKVPKQILVDFNGKYANIIF